MKLWEFHFLKIPFALFHEFHFLLHQSGLVSENKHKSSNSVLTCICKSGFIPLNTLSFIIFFIIKHFCLFQITTVIPHISRLFQTVHYLYLSHIIFLSFKVSKYYSMSSTEFFRKKTLSFTYIKYVKYKKIPFLWLYDHRLLLQ